MTIYLAGPWACKPAIREARAKFEAAGIHVQADWIDHHGAAEGDPAELRRQAYHDLEQIRGADRFVVLAIPGVKSEGKASEFMYAYQGRKHPIVIGDSSQNIFYSLPQTTCVDTVEEAIDALHSYQHAQGV